jgi:hypothetical protein
LRSAATMQAHSFFWHYLWLAPAALLAIVAMTMFRRELHREYPMFFLYALWQVVFTPLLFVLDHLASVTVYQYQYVFWLDDLGSIVLRFAIIYEIFTVLFRPHRALKKLVGGVLGLGLVTLLVIAVTVGAFGPSATHADCIVGSMFLLDRAIAVIQCGLLIVLFLLTWYFNLSWRGYIFGIALGFGVLSATQIVTNALLTQAAQSESMEFVMMGAYHVCTLIWAAYLVIPEPAATVTTVPSVDLESWNRELERLLQRRSRVL